MYGDIGTSPLYAIRECFHGEYAIAPSHENILGVLSLVFWSLLLIVSLKYLTLVMRADNRGEGGVIALTALLLGMRREGKSLSRVFLAFGVFAAALLYGDGMITPAISVLSAVEGLRNVAPHFQPFVLPVTIGILVVLFMFQSRGTERVGAWFGPLTGTWLVVIATLGIGGLIDNPAVLEAVVPTHGVRFLARNGWDGFLILGAVFLVVTGTEALYADMGHFGRRPIRIAWYALVLPALLCSYFGQGAVLLAHPEEASHPFYALAPGWALVPLVILATMATIVASQAVISGAFSLTRQAIQLGYLPRLKIVHTSPEQIGQIYIPSVNALLMLCTIGLVLGFRNSSQLAAAYGVAVATTMFITTVLFALVARRAWRWSFTRTAIPVSLFLVLDVSFFGANVSKILHGAWFPLVIGLAAFTLMTTWRAGRAILYKKMYSSLPRLDEFVTAVSVDRPHRVAGKAVFLTGTQDLVPPALLHNLEHNKILHTDIAVLTIVTEEIPHVPRDEKVEIRDLGSGFHRVVAHYGFMEEANVPYVLALAREKGLDFALEEVSFFLGRERVFPDRRPSVPVWRERLFALMTRNAEGATAFFHIPPDQVVELGAHVEI